MALDSISVRALEREVAATAAAATLTIITIVIIGEISVLH